MTKARHIPAHSYNTTEMVLGYSKSNLPLIGALVDYIETSFEYLKFRNFHKAERLKIIPKNGTVSPTFLGVICIILGLISNIKYEVVTVDGGLLWNDLHLILISNEDKLYADEIDSSEVVWCIEASDLIAVLTSSLLIWNSSRMSSPFSEYCFLPALGGILRGMLTRQAPTACALLYIVAEVEDTVKPLFLTSFLFLFLLEIRLWLEIVRLLRARWVLCEAIAANDQATKPDPENDFETLFCNDKNKFDLHGYVY